MGSGTAARLRRIFLSIVAVNQAEIAGLPAYELGFEYARLAHELSFLSRRLARYYWCLAQKCFRLVHARVWITEDTSFDFLYERRLTNQTLEQIGLNFFESNLMLFLDSERSKSALVIFQKDLQRRILDSNRVCSRRAGWLATLVDANVSISLCNLVRCKAQLVNSIRLLPANDPVAEVATQCTLVKYLLSQGENEAAHKLLNYCSETLLSMISAFSDSKSSSPDDAWQCFLYELSVESLLSDRVDMVLPYWLHREGGNEEFINSLLLGMSSDISSLRLLLPFSRNSGLRRARLSTYSAACVLLSRGAFQHNWFLLEKQLQDARSAHRFYDAGVVAALISCLVQPSTSEFGDYSAQALGHFQSVGAKYEFDGFRRLRRTM